MKFNKKTFLITVFIAILSISMLNVGTTNASAKTSNNTSQKFGIKKLQAKFLKDLRIKYPNATVVSPEKLKKQKNKHKLTTMGSAPALSYLEVYAAISTNYPEYEYFTPD